MTSNASVVVHPHIGEPIALCGMVLWDLLLGVFLKYFPLLFLTTDPKSTLSSLWLCSFHLHNCLLLCVFIHADKLFWRVHVYITRARPGAQHSAAFAKGAWLGLPVQPP